MNSLQKLLKDAEEDFDNTETESAPSGEWAEYNINFLQKESYLEGIQDTINTIGTCDKCMFFDSGMKDYCLRLNITTSSEWYCADLKKIEDKI